MRLLPAKPGASEKEGAPLRRSIPVKSTEVVICTPQQRLAFMATSVHWKKNNDEINLCVSTYGTIR